MRVRLFACSAYSAVSLPSPSPPFALFSHVKSLFIGFPFSRVQRILRFLFRCLPLRFLCFVIWLLTPGSFQFPLFAYFVYFAVSLRSSTLCREDADGVPRGIQHIIPAPIRTHFHGHAHAITLRIIHHGDHLPKLAAGRESLDARRRTGFGG